jgi:PAS domain S-box-containing protein
MVDKMTAMLCLKGPSMMDGLYKLVAIIFLAASIFVLSLSVVCFGAENTIVKPEPEVSLTPEERAWLQANPEITLAFDNDAPPFNFTDKDGLVRGLTIDYVRLIEKKLGLEINLVGSDWSTALNLALKHEVDGILNAAALENRKRFLNFTDVYHSRPQAVVASQNEPNIDSLAALCGRRVAVTTNTSHSRHLQTHFPCIGAVEYQTPDKALAALVTGEVEAVFGDVAVYQTKFEKMCLMGYKVIYMAYLPPAGFARIGVNNEKPLLVSMLNKAIEAITEEEKNRINKKWFSFELPPFTANLAEKQKIYLTPGEKTWLAENPTVRVLVHDQPPFVMFEENGPQGIAIDYLELVAERTGIKLTYVIPAKSYYEALEGFKNQQGPDLLPCVTAGFGDKQNILFSKQYHSAPSVFFTAVDGPFIVDFQDLSGEVVALQTGSALHLAIEKNYPEIKLLLFDTNAEAIQAVAIARAAAYVGDLTIGSHLIMLNGLTNVKVAAPSGLGDDLLSFGIRKDWPELKSIIDKGLDTLSAEEKLAIREKYLSVRYEHGITSADAFKWGLIAVAVSCGVILLFVFWNRSLTQKVNERTFELNKAKESLEAEVRERRQAETEVRESQDYLRSLTNSIPDVVFSVSMPDRKIIWVNDSIRMLGYEVEECVGRTTRFLYLTEEDYLASGENVAQSIAVDKDIIQTEIFLRKKSGEVFSAEVTMSLFKLDGEVVSLTGVLRDISHRKHAEQQIQEYQERLKALAAELTVAGEKERRAVATDLHDHVGHALALARMQLNAMLETTSDLQRSILVKDVSRLLLLALQDTRNLIFELTSPALNELGLSAAISEWLEEQIGKRHGLQTEFIDKIGDEFRMTLDENVRALLFRNVREVLTNVVKHARAHKVIVSLTVNDTVANIVVEDDGVGCDLDTEVRKPGQSGGFGLFSVQERMADLGGSVDIWSAPGKGCRVTLTLPLEKGNNG